MRPARRAWPARESAEQPARAGAGWGAGRAGAEGGADAGDLRAPASVVLYILQSEVCASVMLISGLVSYFLWTR
jgi:hypothetical protein